jgi:hypothetical protein
MDAAEVYEYLVSCVKNSNLNFTLFESPFSVSIQIRKTFIKDKDGTPRTSKKVRNFAEESNDDRKQLEDEIKSPRNAAAEQEDQDEINKKTIHNLIMKLEKAKVQLS